MAHILGVYKLQNVKVRVFVSRARPAHAAAACSCAHRTRLHRGEINCHTVTDICCTCRSIRSDVPELSAVRLEPIHYVRSVLQLHLSVRILPRTRGG